MPWSAQRQLFIALGAFVIFIVLGAASYLFFFYAPPTCTDGVQNQDEEGVDCGGVCARLCVQPNITALWARSVRVVPGVYHTVSLVKNPDTTARGTVPYSVSLFDADNILIATREGTMTLEPGEIAPLFEANIVTGERAPTRTFVEIGTGEWQRAERTPQSVRVLAWDFSSEALRLTATLENQTALPVSNVSVTALLFNEEETLIGASETVLESLAPRERGDVIFTWAEPLSAPPARIDIIPRVR